MGKKDSEVYETMENKRKPDLMLTLAGVMFLVMGIIAYITDLNPVGSVILIAVSIPGIIGGALGSLRKEQQRVINGVVGSRKKEQ